MTGVVQLLRVSLAALVGGLILVGALGGANAGAHPLEWRLEQPSPPVRVAGESPGPPIGLGRVGDIEFWAPNRGLLITDGDPPTIPAGLWAYNGEGWHELATVCGATDGRIAWAGPEEFWTVSDGRPGQAANPQSGEPAPLQDNTLCHFSKGEVVGSYASLAFRPSSYLPMHGAACSGSGDCWFGGDTLPRTSKGRVSPALERQLADRGTRTAGPRRRGYSRFRRTHVREHGAREGDRLSEEESAEHPSILHEISALSPPFVSLLPRSSPGAHNVPSYGEEEFPEALDALHFSSDEEALWGAAGPVAEPPTARRRPP